MKIDPHNHERAYKTWKAKGMLIHGISKTSLNIIQRYLEDMEIGANVSPSAKKGSRSYGRLRNLKTKLKTLTTIFERELGISSLAELENKEREILLLFKKIREGTIECTQKKPLNAVGTYVKAFKAFWHWYQRSQRTIGKEVKDITVDLDGRDGKPKFNYFTIEDLRKLCDHAKFEYKVMMMFLFDTGIRAPTEMMNVRISDLEWNKKNEHYSLNIREETSKTFGRRIKLLLCSQILKEYIIKYNLTGDNLLFEKKHFVVNQYLKTIGHKVLNIGKMRKIQYPSRSVFVVYEGITMYDFRHSSACYWLPRYKSESALKYRFGWKKSDMIHYYTELLGMKDTIEEDDLYVDISKTELEKQLHEKGTEIELLRDQVQGYESKMDDVMKLLKTLELEKLLEQKVTV